MADLDIIKQLKHLANNCLHMLPTVDRRLAEAIGCFETGDHGRR